MECTSCHYKFYGQDCYEAHKAKGNKKGDKSLCERWRKCLKWSAEYQFNPKKTLKCCHATCTNCDEFCHVNHWCFIQPIRPEENNPQDDNLEDPNEFNEEEDENEDKQGPPPPPLLHFTPNLVCWSSEEDDHVIHHCNNIEDLLQALKDLTEVEGDERPCKVITFFHNMRGFDGNFILEALSGQGWAVEKPNFSFP